MFQKPWFPVDLPRKLEMVSNVLTPLFTGSTFQCLPSVVLGCWLIGRLGYDVTKLLYGSERRRKVGLRRISPA